MMNFKYKDCWVRLFGQCLKFSTFILMMVNKNGGLTTKDRNKELRKAGTRQLVSEARQPSESGKI